jgi:MYXO-CTERM domain-containing protein
MTAGMRSVAIAALFVLLAAARTAAASQACVCPADGWTVPPSGAEGVPTNVRIFVHARGSDPIALYTGSDGGTAVEVPARVETTPDPHGVWLVPLQPLEPFTHYSFTGGELTTGAGPVDAPPPSFLYLAPRDRELYGACVEHFSKILDLVGGPVTTTLHPYVMRVDLDGGDQQRVVYLRGGDALAVVPEWPDCGNIHGADDSVTLRAVATVFDWTGHAGAPLPEATFTLDFHDAAHYGNGFGCAVATGRRAPLAAAVLALLVFALRRRRR